MAARLSAAAFVISVPKKQENFNMTFVTSEKDIFHWQQQAKGITI